MYKRITFIAIAFGAFLGVFLLSTIEYSAQKTPPPAQITLQSKVIGSGAATLNGQVVVPVLAQETVLQAMQAYASSSAFTFTGKVYPSLGFFVESINGKENADGYYWTLYIGGKLSGLGASNATVTQDGLVEWRYQKGVE